MVETITPVVHGGRGRWAAALGLHALGAAATAAMFGAALGAVGGLLGAPFGRVGPLALAAVAVAALAVELSDGRVRVPQLRRQVPDWWRTFFGWPTAAFLYGAGLGIGFLTFVAHGTLAVVAAAAFLAGRPGLGALVMAPFGLVRGLSPVVAAGAHTAEAGRHLVDRLVATSERRRSAVNVVVVLAVAGLAAVGALATQATAGWGAAAAAVIAIAFGWAATAKVVARRRWQATLDAHELPWWVRRHTGWLVPAAEALVPALVVAGYRRAAAEWALGMLIAFSFEVLRLRLRGRAAVPCGCFGGTTSVGHRRVALRNTALAAAAIVGIAAASDAPIVRRVALPEASEILPALLATAGSLVALWVALRARFWLGAGAEA